MSGILYDANAETERYEIVTLDLSGRCVCYRYRRKRGPGKGRVAQKRYVWLAGRPITRKRLRAIEGVLLEKIKERVDEMLEASRYAGITPPLPGEEPHVLHVEG